VGFVEWLKGPALTPAQAVLSRCRGGDLNLSCSGQNVAGFEVAAFFEVHAAVRGEIPVRLAYQNSTPNRFRFSLEASGAQFVQGLDELTMWSNPTRTPAVLMVREPAGVLTDAKDGDWVGLEFKPDSGTSAEPFDLTVVARPAEACPCCN